MKSAMTIAEQMMLNGRFNEAWNEGARPGDTNNLGFLEQYEPEAIQQLYGNLLISLHFLESKVATLEDYCEGHYISLPGGDQILDELSA